ncbi:MAG: guanylate kinase [Planctomycetota bacterium]|nr:guanylate kinase [Planctomycetota bacterium]
MDGTVTARGILVVLSGPSGVGKTVVSEGLQEKSGFVRAITATTRAPREGEKDGVDYHFLDRERFEKRVEDGGFLEHAEVHGNLYGSPRDGIERQLEESRAVLLLIDVQGAEKLRQDEVDALQIFLEPPGVEELRHRIESRGDETEETIALRLRNALSELEQKERYDRCVVNDVLEETISMVSEIIEEELGRRGLN